MENQAPTQSNTGDNQMSNINSNAESLPPPTNLFPVTATPPSTDFAFSAQTPQSIQESDAHSRSRYVTHVPSPSRMRLDSEYSSRLQLNQQNLSVISPPGIRRGRNRNFTFFSSRGSFESSDESKASNTKSAFFTPDRSPSSDEKQTTMLNSFSPTTADGSSTSWPTRNLASVSIDASDTGYSDRFIPSRAASNLSFQFSDAESDDRNSNLTGNINSIRNIDPETNIATQTGSNEPDGTTTNTTTSRGSEVGNSQTLLNALLRSELLRAQPEDRPGSNMTGTPTPQREKSNLFRFQSPRLAYSNEVLRDSSAVVNSFNLSPVESASSHRLLATPQKRKRKIGKVPFKVLDAPSLQDDFYLNLVDWYVV